MTMSERDPGSDDLEDRSIPPLVANTDSVAITFDSQDQEWRFERVFETAGMDISADGLADMINSASGGIRDQTRQLLNQEGVEEIEFETSATVDGTRVAVLERISAEGDIDRGTLVFAGQTGILASMIGPMAHHSPEDTETILQLINTIAMQVAQSEMERQGHPQPRDGGVERVE